MLLPRVSPFKKNPSPLTTSGQENTYSLTLLFLRNSRPAQILWLLPSLSPDCLLQMLFRAWSFTSFGSWLKQPIYNYSPSPTLLPAWFLILLPDAHSFLIDSVVYFCLPSRLAGIFICPFTALSLDCFGAPGNGFPCTFSFVLVPPSSSGLWAPQGQGPCLGIPRQQDRLEACRGYSGSSCGKSQHALW